MSKTRKSCAQDRVTLRCAHNRYVRTFDRGKRIRGEFVGAGLRRHEAPQDAGREPELEANGLAQPEVRAQQVLHETKLWRADLSRPRHATPRHATPQRPATRSTVKARRGEEPHTKRKKGGKWATKQEEGGDERF